MQRISELLETWQTDRQFIKYVFSSPRDKKGELRGLKLYKNKEGHTAELKYHKHNNLIHFSTTQEILKFTSEHSLQFKQYFFQFQQKELQVLLNKKGDAKVITKKNQSLPQEQVPNRSKNYLIADNIPCDFLIETGIMTPQGKVKSNQYKKFRQINRFLEYVHDSFKEWERDQISVVDFGCGKSYLTFALYYYFSSIKKIQVQITGLDLKQDVIESCSQLAKKLNYTNLKFQTGFVKDFKQNCAVDFVVTLHACDTATDDAIVFALKAQAKHMFFVPCCQHELNQQLKNLSQAPLLKHGIFKDRITALITDSVRSQLLEIEGYKVQCLEFIESEHTAKNILLRCKKVERPSAQIEKLKQDYSIFKQEWGISPYLEREIASSLPKDEYQPEVSVSCEIKE